MRRKQPCRSSFTRRSVRSFGNLGCRSRYGAARFLSTLDDKLENVFAYGQLRSVSQRRFAVNAPTVDLGSVDASGVVTNHLLPAREITACEADALASSLRLIVFETPRPIVVTSFFNVVTRSG